MSTRSTYSSPAALETALGDPFDPTSMLSFHSAVFADEKEQPPGQFLELARDWDLNQKLIPIAYGGNLGAFDDLLSWARVISRRNPVVTLGLGSTFLAAIPVWIWGTEQQRANVVELLGSAEFGAFGFSERDAGSDIFATKTEAVAAGEGFEVTGEKWLIGNAGRCAFTTLFARGPEGLSLFLLETESLSAEAFRRLPRIPTLGLRGHDLGGFAFSQCLIPRESVLGPPGRGVEMALTTLQFTRALIAGICLGAADSALRIALRWASERRLYGDQILELAPVRAVLVRSFVDLLIAEAVAVSTARALTAAPERSSLLSAVAKYLVPQLCEQVVRDTTTVLSARFYLREGVADGMFQKIARDISIASIFEGTQFVQLELIAAQLRSGGGVRERSASRGDRWAEEARLFTLDEPVPDWDPLATEMRLTAPAGQDVVDLWLEPTFPDQLVEQEAAVPREVVAALSESFALLSERTRALMKRSAEETQTKQTRANARLAQAQEYCYLHAAGACFKTWVCNRESLGGAFADGHWLVLALRRLISAGALSTQIHTAPEEAEWASEAVLHWMTQLQAGYLFSAVPLELGGRRGAADVPAAVAG